MPIFLKLPLYQAFEEIDWAKSGLNQRAFIHETTRIPPNRATTELRIVSLASGRLVPKLETINNALDDLKDSLREALESDKRKEQRTICKRFYLTEAEEIKLNELRQGINLSTFIRAKVLGNIIPRPRAIPPQINREACTHLANIRANCNQIAKAINTAAQQNKELPLTQAYLDQLTQLETLLVEIGLQLSQAQNTNAEEAEA